MEFVVLVNITTLRAGFNMKLHGNKTPYSLNYAVKFFTLAKERKTRAGISFPALTITRLIRLLVAD